MASRTRALGAVVAAYVVGVGAYWLWPRSADEDARAEIAVAADPRAETKSPPGAAPPAPVPSLSWQVHAVEAPLSDKQEMLLEHPERGTRTWAAAGNAIVDLQRLALERGWQERGWLPHDCATDETPAAVFEASFVVAASAERVVVSGYRVVDAALPAQVRDCFERYFSGEAVVDRYEGAPPFLDFETTVRREQHWLVRPVTPPREGP